MKKPMDEQVVYRIERLNYILGVLAAAVFAIAAGTEMALGVLVGAAISAVNFTLIRKLVLGALRSGEGEPSAGALLFVPKFVAMAVAVALAIYYLPVSPVGVAVGFSVFLVSIGVETARLFTTRSSHG